MHTIRESSLQTPSALLIAHGSLRHSFEPKDFGNLARVDSFLLARRREHPELAIRRRHLHNRQMRVGMTSQTYLHALSNGQGLQLYGFGSDPIAHLQIRLEGVCQYAKHVFIADGSTRRNDLPSRRNPLPYHLRHAGFSDTQTVTDFLHGVTLQKVHGESTA
jgi:hypothetical protein